MSQPMNSSVEILDTFVFHILKRPRSYVSNALCLQEVLSLFECLRSEILGGAEGNLADFCIEMGLDSMSLSDKMNEIKLLDEIERMAYVIKFWTSFFQRENRVFKEE